MGVQASGGRPSSPASQSPKARKIAAYCRRVLTDAARAATRSASPNKLRSWSPGTAGGGEGERTLADATALEVETELGVDELQLGVNDRRERELPLAHRERLFPKPPMPGYVKPRLGRQEPLDPARSRVRIMEFSNLSAERAERRCGVPSSSRIRSQAPSVHSGAARSFVRNTGVVALPWSQPRRLLQLMSVERIRAFRQRS